MKHLTEKQTALLTSKYGEAAVKIYREITDFVESGALAQSAAATDEEIDKVVPFI